MADTVNYSPMNDYARIAKIIKFIDEGHIEQPSLQNLADHIGLSQHHGP